MRDTVLEKVRNYTAEHGMLEHGMEIIVGVSGGADSVCLLHLLKRLAPEYELTLRAVHINHGVRRDAAADEIYVEELCSSWELPFVRRRVDMEGYAEKMRLSPEEAGRELRYGIFEELRRERAAQGKNVRIAVAHNANDRAETMLFHMFRGSGLKGLCSIQPVRGAVIRPVLCLTREEIEAYLERQQVTYCSDSTNEEDHYARNRIRHHVLSYAEREICVGSVQHMNELAQQLSETENFLAEQTETALSRCRIPGELPSIDLQCFRREPELLRKRILRRLLSEMTTHCRDITKRHIDAMDKLADADGCKVLMLPYGLCVRKEYGRIYLERINPEEKKESEEEFSFRVMDRSVYFSQRMENISENRYTKCFDYDKIITSMLVRTRQPGDYLTIDAALHKKTVKEYMINEKIPKWKRDSIRLLADGSHVMWIPGYRISQYYKVDENTRRIVEVRIRGGEDDRKG